MKEKVFPVGALFAMIVALLIDSILFACEGEELGDVLLASLFIFAFGGGAAGYAISSASPSAPSFPHGGSETRWRSVDMTQIQQLTASAQNTAEYSPMGKAIKTYFASALGFVFFIVLTIVAICMRWFLAAILLFNVPFVASICAELMRIDRPSYKYRKIPLMDMQISQLLAYNENLKLNLKLDTQVCVKDELKEETGTRVPFIDDDIRVMVSRESESNPASWLCAMFSFSKNDYRGTDKPYTYFVVVIDKNKMKASSSEFRNDYERFSSFIEDRYSNLTCELKEDDNYVIVVRKSESAFIPYETRDDDLKALVEVASKAFLVKSFQ